MGGQPPDVRSVNSPSLNTLFIKTTAVYGTMDAII